MRESLGIANWEDASRLVREWECGTKPPEEMRVKEAIDKFLEDAKSRFLSDASIQKLRFLLEKQLVPFCERKRISTMRQITFSDIIEFRQTWADAALSAYKKFERLRTFFRFCKHLQWCENVTEGLKAPKVLHKPTMPFTAEEVERIVWACDLYSNNGRYGQGNKARMKAFVLIMRYTGLRIRDVVCLQRSALQDGRLFVRTQKTGVPVRLPLPPFVLEAMEKVSPVNNQYFFWSGLGLPKSAVADWQRSFRKLLHLAGVKGHPHMMRDTFAISLLEKGIPTESVAALLGNTPAIVQKHYSPWVKSRQLLLEKQLMETW
jgi:site-specific recombinase XerD